ncbi:MBL fold metallo-hydrolase [Candidatus Microgenomates bacterium]|jgi:hypothetical protein|nr:MAG: MBL fold metallo-hydrolase [Candidatus Microgenomates bacterium]
MKKDFAILIFFAVIGLIVYAFSFYIPKEVHEFASRLNQTSPEGIIGLSDKRKNLLLEFDDFFLNHDLPRVRDQYLTFEFPYLYQYKLLNIKLDKILEEISSVSIKDKQLKLWYVYNMGVVVKSKDKTLCFDLSAVVPNKKMSEIAQHCDLLFISHEDGDHYSNPVIKSALNAGRTVIVGKDEIGYLEQKTRQLSKKGQVVSVAHKQSMDISGIRVKAFATTHRGSRGKANFWFLVEAEGRKILHTGDGLIDDKNTEVGKVDVVLMNEYLPLEYFYWLPVDTIIPLHLHEMAHSKSFYLQANYGEYLKKYEEHTKKVPDAGKMKHILLFWGESLDI